MVNHRRMLLVILASTSLVASVVGPAGAGSADQDGERVSRSTQIFDTSLRLAPAGAVATAGQLEMYEATIDGVTLQQLVNNGYDVTVVDQILGGIKVALVLTAGERTALQAKGVDLSVWRNAQGQSVARMAAEQQANGFNVYRSFDEPGGIRDELYQIAAENPGLVKLRVLGESHQGREYIALKVTQGARKKKDGARPAVLYVATHHAREWISTEVARRLLHWYVDEWHARNDQVRRLLRKTELWFVLVHNPDGYEYTFDVERLWRKNLRDNDGNGIINSLDGVDPNRNYPEHWKYDEEGSSSEFTSETYRGPTAGSEPETQALMRLFRRVPFRFSISYHSFGQLLLYTQGWQVQTPSADDPIYVALSGTDDDPAIPEYDPGVGADLYTTNGEYTDWAHAERDALSWTPELSEGCEGCGFVFPDDEALVQAEFERNLQFALNVALSARDPDDPVSHAGIDTKRFYLDVSEIDPWKSGNPLSDLRVEVSHGGGTSQIVEVLAKRAVGKVTLVYEINDGRRHRARTRGAPPGEVFGGNNAYNAYYRYLRGRVRRIDVGDTVEYWFKARGKQSDRTTFEVVAEPADVLILAAEDYTGASPEQDLNGPHYLSFYEAAVPPDASYNVYDVDAEGREAPDHMGVLNHYDAAVWYTGDDFVPREPGWGPGNASRLANDEILEARSYLNETGHLLYTGQNAGGLFNGIFGSQYYDPVANEQCISGLDDEGNPIPSPIFDRCQLISDKNDFLQYYLGAYLYNVDAGTQFDEEGNPTGLFPVDGVEEPYTGLSWEFNGADSAQNQFASASFLTTSSILKPDEFPQFTSWAPAVWDTGVTGGFQPFEGEWYVYSQQADVSYKRLMRSFTVPASGGDMTFRMSYDTEPAWDFVFVEIHDVAADTWVTAPDQNGHTTSDTGDSCPEGWHELHPWLEQYQGADCAGAGWNAASGRSQGWEEWSIDLTPYAGKQIEISISYASDWAIQGLGAFVDSVQVPGEPIESFEAGLGAWTTPGPPPGSAANANDWTRTQDVGFDEGAVVAEAPPTADFRTLYFGFGFEGITGASTRQEVMDRALSFFGV
jgi:hypothetical protein